MQFTGFYTEAGAQLIAMALTGTHTLSVTRVTAGSGSTTTAARALAMEQQSLTVTGQLCQGADSIVVATLAAAEAMALYGLQEIGVYAATPEGGDVLCRVYRLDQALSISPDSALSVTVYLHDLVAAGTPAQVELRTADLVSESRCRELMADAASFRDAPVTLSCTPEKLPDVLQTVPLPLCSPLTVLVSAGTLNGNLQLEDLWGTAPLHIHAFEGMEVTGGLCLRRCRLPRLQITGVTFQCGAVLPTGETSGFTQAGAVVTDCAQVLLKGCALGNTAGGLSLCAGICCRSSRLFLYHSVLTGFGTGIVSTDLAQVFCTAAISGGMPSCGAACLVRMGGLICSDQTDLQLIGGTGGKSAETGGRILMGTQWYGPAS